MRVDVDDQNELAEKTGVIVKEGYYVPTFQLYKNGIKIGDDLQRADKKTELEEMIKKYSSCLTSLSENKVISGQNRNISKKSTTCVCL